MVTKARMKSEAKGFPLLPADVYTATSGYTVISGLLNGKEAFPLYLKNLYSHFARLPTIFRSFYTKPVIDNNYLPMLLLAKTLGGYAWAS